MNILSLKTFWLYFNECLLDSKQKRSGLRQITGWILLPLSNCKKCVQNEKLKHEAIKICLCRLYKIDKNIIYKDGILSSLHPRIVHYLLPNLIRLSKPYIWTYHLGCKRIWIPEVKDTKLFFQNYSRCLHNDSLTTQARLK